MLNQFIRDRYLPHAQASKRSWTTDETVLRIHILPALGRLTLNLISGEHIAGLINDMRSKGYAGGASNRGPRSGSASHRETEPPYERLLPERAWRVAR